MEDAKGKAALIVAAMGKPAKAPEAEPDPSDANEGQEDAKTEAVDSMMSALKANDAAAFKTALSDFIDMCY